MMKLVIRLIWFMINLENTPIGKIKRIPTYWFIKVLKETRDIKNSSPERLNKGRRVLIEKLLARVGSFDYKIMKGVSIRSILRPNEAKSYEACLTNYTKKKGEGESLEI